MERLSPAERALALVVRGIGVLLASAVFAIVLPTAWMEAVHSAVGLGTMPRGPLVEYLTRTCSAMYAVHGAVLIFASFDVRRYLPMIRFIAFQGMALGLVVLAIDLAVGMPPLWTWGEGPVIFAGNVCVLAMANRAGRG